MATQKVPPEVWGKIFEMSCTDNGQTGRSLALVSRYIHAVSKPFQYQSIAIVGPEAIEHFASFLANTPECRRVKYLFMSTFKPDPAVLRFILKGPLQSHTIIPSPSHHQPQIPSGGSSYITKGNNAILADMHCVLDFVASSIRNLHIIMDFYRDEIFFPMEFPVMEELSIQGPFHDHYDCNVEFCDTLYPPTPSLRRLYLTDVFTCIKDRTFLAIRHYAPYLTHLKIQCADGYIESSRTFLKQLLPSSRSANLKRDEEGNYGGRGREGREESKDDGSETREPRFPETLQRILLHPGPGQPRGRCGAVYMIRCAALRELEKCANDDPRIELFKESPWVWPFSRDCGFIEGEQQWLGSMAGSSGSWE